MCSSQHTHSTTWRARETRAAREAHAVAAVADAAAAADADAAFGLDFAAEDGWAARPDGGEDALKWIVVVTVVAAVLATLKSVLCDPSPAGRPDRLWRRRRRNGLPAA